MPRHHIEYIAKNALSRGLFDSRWIMVPFYIGLVLTLLILLFVFCRELLEHARSIMRMGSSDAIIMSLSLIDLSLVANLILIVTLAGCENFVSRIDAEGNSRPTWMGTIDFAGMKMKLMASISAISSIALLRLFMKMSENIAVNIDALRWMVIVHGALLLSTVVLAITDWLNFRTGPGEGSP